MNNKLNLNFGEISDEDMKYIDSFGTSKFSSPTIKENKKEIIKVDHTDLKRIKKPKSGYKSLGIFEGNNYIYSYYRQSLVMLTSKDFTKQNMINILGLEYLNEKYPVFNNKGDRVGYDLSNLQNDLVKECVNRGIYQLDTIKGFGVYKDPLSKGNLIINTTEIWGTCDSFDGSRVRGNIVFQKDLDLIVSKISKEITKEEANELYDFFNSWNFKRGRQDIYFLVGWLMTAMLAGALDWLTHASLTGPRGTGKSTLMDILSNILDRLGLLANGSSSEAGIRQKVRNASCGVLLDETEADAYRLNQILTMFRNANDGKAQQLMGTSDQKGTSYQLKFAGFLAGICPPALSPADASRFLMLELNPLDTTKNSAKTLDVKWQSDIGKKLLMFCINNYNLLNKYKNDFTDLMLAKGADNRYCATNAGLIGNSYALYGEGQTKEQFLNNFDMDKQKDLNNEKDEEKLLDYLLAAEIKDDEINNKTILEHIFDFNNGKNKSGIKSLLGRYGIRAENERSHKVIYIDCKDINLPKLLKGTKFANTNLKVMFMRLNDIATEPERNFSINNSIRTKNRLVRIELSNEKYNELTAEEAGEEIAKMFDKE